MPSFGTTTARARSEHVALARPRAQHLRVRRPAQPRLDDGGGRDASNRARRAKRSRPRWATRGWPTRSARPQSVRVRMRTSVLTLVVVAPRPETVGTCPGGDQRPSPAPPVARDRRLAGRLRRAVDDGRAHLRRVQGVRALRLGGVHRADPDQDRRRAVAAPVARGHAAADPRPAGRRLVARRSAVRRASSSARWSARPIDCWSTRAASRRTTASAWPAWRPSSPTACR